MIIVGNIVSTNAWMGTLLFNSNLFDFFAYSEMAWFRINIWFNITSKFHSPSKWLYYFGKDGIIFSSRFIEIISTISDSYQDNSLNNIYCDFNDISGMVLIGTLSFFGGVALFLNHFQNKNIPYFSKRLILLTFLNITFVIFKI